MNARDELAKLICSSIYEQDAADHILAAGYRKIFDGDCGLSNVKDPSDREASEAWMRWANLVSGNGHDGIAAMRQMLTEFGYRKPRTITDPEELDSLEVRATILDGNGHVWTNDGDCSDQWGSVTTTESYGGPQWVTSFDITLPATILHEPQP